MSFRTMQLRKIMTVGSNHCHVRWTVIIAIVLHLCNSDHFNVQWTWVIAIVLEFKEWMIMCNFRLKKKIQTNI